VVSSVGGMRTLGKAIETVYEARRGSGKDVRGRVNGRPQKCFSGLKQRRSGSFWGSENGAGLANPENALDLFSEILFRFRDSSVYAVKIFPIASN
jgi:hypothetical protein